MVEWFDPQISVAIDLMRYAKKIIAFTGAGISTDSGIPDFRSPGGLWENYNPLKYANYNVFLKQPEYYWQLERELIPIFAKAKPNNSHKALVELEKKGKLKAIITQNMDNFHQMVGSKVPIIEIHGNAYKAHCMDCQQEIRKGYILKRLKANNGIPTCPSCGGRVKTDVILFNEPIADELFDQAMFYAEDDCEVFLVIGSSLSVFPANQIPLLAKKAGAKLIYINRDPTLMDKHANLRLLGDVGRILPYLVSQI